MKNLMFLVLVALAGIALAFGGWFAFKEELRFLDVAVPARGTVTFVRAEGSGSSTSYHPSVEFKTRDGKRNEFRSRQSGRPNEYYPGQPVPVLYDPGNPQKAEINSGPISLLLGPLLLLGTGLLGVLIGIGGALTSLFRRTSSPPGGASPGAA